MLETALWKLVPLLLLSFQRQPEDMVRLSGGNFAPMFPAVAEEKTVDVAPFWLDRLPVSNLDFLRFVVRKPSFRRERISPLFAESGYLQHWQAATALGPSAAPLQPVVNVSWFAAKAYCESRGARLPTEVEWEFAAAASETERDARDSRVWRESVLEWYSHSASGQLGTVGRGRPNFWGVRNLHGLVWEWVLDFNSVLVSSDSRSAGEANRQTFCGAGALKAGDNQDYASFMRLAFQSSLRANYVTASLGFRCARDAAGESS